MKINKKAISIVESIIVVLIIAIGLVGVYKLYTTSIKFLDGVEAKIQATQIAREGVEAVENIRDTNWLLFPSRRDKCWNVVDYDANCISGSATTMSGTYKIYRDENSRWRLAEDTNPPIDNFFKVGVDSNGFYTQSGTTVDNTYIDKRNYTRKIIITPGVDLKYIDNFGSPTTEANSGSGMTITSLVEWKDMASSQPRKIEIVNVLTNYKE